MLKILNPKKKNSNRSNLKLLRLQTHNISIGTMEFAKYLDLISGYIYTTNLITPLPIFILLIVRVIEL